uniref:Uncharacterized protein n=1 Tax=Emiliania huxleyi TaxID=2903 RepID=A0A7S3SRA3_EMIHU
MAPARAQSAVRSSGTGVGSNWWAALLDGPRSRSDRTSRLRSCTARAARLTSAAGKHRAARLLLDAALRARQAATSRGELLVVARALLRAVACARGDAPLQRSARERLALLLCQEGLASEAGLDALLARGGYSHRLASHCLRYEEEEAAPSAAGRAAAMAWHCLARPVPPPVPPPGGGARGGAFVACLEGALPRGMVGRLAAALGPSSPFWASHGYICDGVRLASPFFSYVHSLRGRAPYCLNMYSTYSKRPPKGLYSARIRRIPTVFHTYSRIRIPNEAQKWTYKMFLAPRIQTEGRAPASACAVGRVPDMTGTCPRHVS